MCWVDSPSRIHHIQPLFLSLSLSPSLPQIYTHSHSFTLTYSLSLSVLVCVCIYVCVFYPSSLGGGACIEAEMEVDPAFDPLVIAEHDPARLARYMPKKPSSRKPVPRRERCVFTCVCVPHPHDEHTYTHTSHKLLTPTIYVCVSIEPPNRRQGMTIEEYMSQAGHNDDDNRDNNNENAEAAAAAAAAAPMDVE